MVQQLMPHGMEGKLSLGPDEEIITDGSPGKMHHIKKAASISRVIHRQMDSLFQKTIINGIAARLLSIVFTADDSSREPVSRSSIHYIFLTLTAVSPFGPFWVSKETLSFSFRAIVMELICTKMLSWLDSSLMKP